MGYVQLSFSLIDERKVGGDNEAVGTERPCQRAASRYQLPCLLVITETVADHRLEGEEQGPKLGGLRFLRPYRSQQPGRSYEPALPLLLELPITGDGKLEDTLSRG